MFERRGHDVLGQAVQPVCQLTTAGWPPRGEPFVASPTQQQGLGAQRLVERGLVQIVAVLDLADPAADPETLVTGRVLDHPVERSEEHTSELQSLRHLVCRLLLEKKKHK